MKTQAIKKKYKHLEVKELVKIKNQISTFLFHHPDVDRSAQGFVTIDVLHNLIQTKQNDNKFIENVLKNLFFE